MENFDINRIGSFEDSLNNLNISLQKQAKEDILNRINSNDKIQDAIKFRNSQRPLIDRIKSDGENAKRSSGVFSSRVNSYINQPLRNNGVTSSQSGILNQNNKKEIKKPEVLKVDIEAAKRAVEAKKTAVLNAVSKLTNFRQQVFSTIISGAKRDYGQNMITKDLPVFQQVRGLYNLGDFTIEQYDNFYNIAASMMDIQDPEKSSYFLDLIGKAAKRQGAGITLGMARSIMNTALTSRPPAFKSPVANIGTEPVLRRIDLDKITEQSIKSFYQNIKFKAKPIGGGRFGVVISDGQRKATVFEMLASDQAEYRQALEERYKEQMAAKLRRTIKPMLSRSTRDIKEINMKNRSSKRKKN